MSGHREVVVIKNRRFKCARQVNCIYRLVPGVCIRQPKPIAVDRFGHYGNHGEPNENYPLSVDLHWCPFRGEEIDGKDGKLSNTSLASRKEVR